VPPAPANTVTAPYDSMLTVVIERVILRYLRRQTISEQMSTFLKNNGDFGKSTVFGEKVKFLGFVPLEQREPLSLPRSQY